MSESEKQVFDPITIPEAVTLTHKPGCKSPAESFYSLVKLGDDMFEAVQVVNCFGCDMGVYGHPKKTAFFEERPS